jgi:UDP-N-acetyl-2-amino-2-deoxyglucuronate dehydrogenase
MAAIRVALLTHAGGAHVGNYLAALAATDECSEVVLGDPDGRWEEQAREALGSKLTRVGRDLTALVDDEKPGMALVTMEAKLAPPIIARALQAGCHVFAEKPACVRLEDFQPLAEHADRTHRHLMLALANRLNPETVAARRLVQSGQIGAPYGLELHLVADQTRLTREPYHQQWFAQRERAGGGHLIWLGIHWLDLAMHITGANIQEVVGFTANVGGQPLDVEDSAAATLKFDNGTLGTLTSGYYLDKGYHQHVQIWGSAGWVRIDAQADQPLTWYSTKGPQAGTVQTWDGSKQPRGYTPFVQAAVRACANETAPPITTAESLRALRTVFGIYKAAAEGRSVSVG